MSLPQAVPGWIAARSPRALLVLAALAGAVGGLGQAPFDAPVSAVLGLAGLSVLILCAPSARRAALVALLGGAGYFAVALHWIVEPFLVDPFRHGWMAPFALLLMAFGMALFWAVAAGISRMALPDRAGWLARALVWAAGWAGAEYARATVLTGFPWAHPGHIWIDTGLLPLASFAGPQGFTLYTCMMAGLLGAGVLARSRLALALPVLHLGLVTLAGLVPPAPQAAPDAPVIRLIQPNAPQHLKWRPDMVGVFFERAVGLSAEGPRPDLVIWPETSLPTVLHRAETLRQAIAQRVGGVPVILGAQRFEGDSARNTLVHLGPGGEIAALYDKHHLVPFGEYLPFGALARGLGLRGLADMMDAGGYGPGPGPALLPLGPALGQAFPMICYEAIFPRYVAQVARPDWMIHITNDAWFGQFSGPYQHLALARLRAAEQGLPLLRAANTGVSAVIDARGQVLAALALGETGALDARLPPPLPPTAYARTGDWPALLVLLATVGAGLMLGRRKPVAA